MKVPFVLSAVVIVCTFIGCSSYPKALYESTSDVDRILDHPMEEVKGSIVDAFHNFGYMGGFIDSTTSRIFYSNEYRTLLTRDTTNFGIALYNGFFKKTYFEDSLSHEPLRYFADLYIRLAPVGRGQTALHIRSMHPMVQCGQSLLPVPPHFVHMPKLKEVLPSQMAMIDFLNYVDARSSRNE